VDAVSHSELASIAGTDGFLTELDCGGQKYPVVTNEFWTSKQRQASNLHEISYRACFKPQLVRYFVERLTSPGDIVYDPFGGRGTTAIEAALLGRRVISNDINPLSRMLAEPRLKPPCIEAVIARLDDIDFATRYIVVNVPCDLGMFFHHETEAELRALQIWFYNQKNSGCFDNLDAWIRMVATNRLTGHSPGFFSVYTLPPNQAVSRERQIKLNKKRNQTPEYRDTNALIIKKSRQLLNGLTHQEVENLRSSADTARFLTHDARHTSEIEDNSVSLTVTSPPFLDVVQYKNDNWLRCWFCGLDAEDIG